MIYKELSKRDIPPHICGPEIMSYDSLLMTPKGRNILRLNEL